MNSQTVPEYSVSRPPDPPRIVTRDTERLRRARGEAYLSRQRVQRLEQNPTLAADDPELARERRLQDLFDQVVATLMDV